MKNNCFADEMCMPLRCYSLPYPGYNPRKHPWESILSVFGEQRISHSNTAVLYLRRAEKLVVMLVRLSLQGRFCVAGLDYTDNSYFFAWNFGSVLI